MDKRTIVVNLFAGPGAGKSSCCAGVFERLKWSKIDTEMALEYAKDKVWEGSINMLDNQIYIFAKQQHRIFRLAGKVDVVVTDSPLLLSMLYDNTGDPNFAALVMNQFNKYNNLNFFINRKKDYNPNGRMQTESQAVEKDLQLKDILDSKGIEYTEIDGTENAPDIIVEHIKKMLVTNNA